MNILSWFISSWPRMGADEPVDLESWRIWLVKIAVILGVILLPLGMITSFPVFMADGNFVMIAFDCLVWFILLSRLFSKADSFKANA